MERHYAYCSILVMYLKVFLTRGITGTQVRTCNLLFIFSTISAKVKCGYEGTKW